MWRCGGSCRPGVSLLGHVPPPAPPRQPDFVEPASMDTGCDDLGADTILPEQLGASPPLVASGAGVGPFRLGESTWDPRAWSCRRRPVAKEPSALATAAWGRMSRALVDGGESQGDGAQGQIVKTAMGKDMWEKVKQALKKVPIMCSIEVYPEWKSASPATARPTRNEPRVTVTSSVVVSTAAAAVADRMSTISEQRSEYSSAAVSPANSKGSRTLQAGDELREDGSCMQRFMVKPQCGRKICWDLLSFFIMGYDILTIPLFAAFDMQPITMTMMLDWVITSFWTADLVCTFFTGFYDKGITEMRPSVIAKRYLQTWFVADFCIVSVDWTVIFMDSSGAANALGILRIFKSIRIARILRLLRLLRVMKIIALLESFSELIHSESLQTGIGIVKLVCGIAALNHFIACGWYGLGSSGWEESSWVRKFEANYGGEDEPELGYRYTTSLHWSLTQFTPASMEVVPRNAIERMYTICVILLALVMFSSFVSSITSAMTHLRSIKLEQMRQQENVRRFITDHKLSSELGHKVHNFVRHHRASKRRVHESDIAILRFMPEQVRVQMHLEVFLPPLLKHPLFLGCQGLDTSGLARVCHSAMSEVGLVLGEELFTFHEKCSRMYFVISGAMSYYHNTQDGDTGVEVGVDARISEIVLWAPWEHHGRLVTTSTVDLIALESAKFRSIANLRGKMRGPCITYAQAYARRFFQVCGGREFLSDIWEDGSAIEELAQEALMGEGELENYRRMPPRQRSGTKTFDSFLRMLDGLRGTAK